MAAKKISKTSPKENKKTKKVNKAPVTKKSVKPAKKVEKKIQKPVSKKTKVAAPQKSSKRPSKIIMASKPMPIMPARKPEISKKAAEIFK